MLFGKMLGIQRNVDQIFFSNEQFEKPTVNFPKNLVITVLFLLEIFENIEFLSGFLAVLSFSVYKVEQF